MSDDPRPHPEQFLAEANAEAGGAGVPRGRLKLFLGASPGVGKTYAMLEEALGRDRAGTDVAVALAETHGRKETAALLAQLDQLPRRVITYRDRQMSEMDLDALLARRPQLALIDELAHTNVPGSRHPKRWQDVEEVLAEGIDVYSTLNIQHIESLNDLVARITGIRVQETVPDTVLQMADEIKLIDLPPEDLIQRMREGKVYMPAEAGRALSNFFSKPNLTALRELALRTAASRVDADMATLRRGLGTGPSQDRLMVCLDDPATAKGLVRAGRRMTDRARIPWVVATVVTPAIEGRGPAATGAMSDALQLAERLGAETRMLRAEGDVAQAFVEAARQLNVTRLILGRSARAGWVARLSTLIRPTLTQRLVAQAEGFEVTLLDPAPDRTTPAAIPSVRRRSVAFRPALGLLLHSVMATTAATLIAWPFWHILPVASLAVIYLVAVLAVAMRQGTAGAIATSVCCFLAYNFFFTGPYFSFRVAAEESFVALMVFTISALFTGRLAGRLKKQIEFMRADQTRTETLYDFARKIASATTTDDVLWAAAAHIAHTLQCHSLILMPRGGGILEQVQGFPSIEEELDPHSQAAALWAFQKNVPAGRDTDTLPTAGWMFLPLATQGAPIGAVGLRFIDPDRRLDPNTRRLLAAVEDQIAVAVERISVEGDLEQARLISETEKLRAALLNSVSHDLRTPLVTVIGALSAVADGGLPLEQNQKLVVEALDEARRLDRFVGNLLVMTRLGHGALRPRREIVPVDELIGRARSDLARVLAPFHVETETAPGTPPLSVDPVLIGQAITNLLENATKYAPEGSTIRIAAEQAPSGVALTVMDEGPGIPASERDRVFDIFHRAVQGDGHPAGTGLGLAIVKGMVEAHDGSIEVIDPPGSCGAAIRMILPAAVPGDADA
ncbi:sensor histidine kinase [Paracoccus aerius]|uniref:histidine kinase n=1 Tax=Paracoccus aerius TaxID=1915382 RepID=A0ABS1S9W6_9RHOB|nr:sensor histidine kinase KdpD [Paracoccus aerius]MBL3675314.1 sensor histidine kinase KdpD [Paracoccus aerius]GHG21032.1 two-component sensor histidine kinase [Paracoccus aerius]